MKIYLNGVEAISDLHKNGFTNDFQLFGNELLWVQENIVMKAGDYAILEYHKITEPKRNMDELVVFGIIAPYHNIKGILVSHNKSSANNTPLVIARKLNELNTPTGMFIQHVQDSLGMNS